jgi:hypothetical protein
MYAHSATGRNAGADPSFGELPCEEINIKRLPETQRAEVVSAELFFQQLATLDEAFSALDLRFGRVSPGDACSSSRKKWLFGKMFVIRVSHNAPPVLWTFSHGETARRERFTCSSNCTTMNRLIPRH